MEVILILKFLVFVKEKNTGRSDFSIVKINLIDSSARSKIVQYSCGTVSIPENKPMANLAHIFAYIENNFNENSIFTSKITYNIEGLYIHN